MLLTPEEYGHYYVTLSTFGLIRVFSMVWLSSNVTRFYLNYKDTNRRKEFFSTLFFTTIPSSLFVALVSFCINFFIFKNKMVNELYILINIAIAASIVNSFFEIFVMIYRAGLEPHKYSFYWVLYSVGKPVLGIVLIVFFNFRTEGIFWGFLIVPLILDIVLFFKLELFNFVRLKNVTLSLCKKFSHYGTPYILSFLSFWILTLSDRYLIEYFQTSQEVGFYSVGYTISEKTLNFVYTIIMLAAYPIIVENWEKYGKTQTQQLITETTRVFLLVCTPILLVLVAVPKQVLLLFSSSDFIQGARALPLIAVGIYIYGLNQYVLKGFELLQKSFFIGILALFAGVLDIILNIILIPKMGYLGAGISACIAYIFYFIATIVTVKRIMPWVPPVGTIKSVLIAGIIMLALFKVGLYINDSFLFVIITIPVNVLIFFGLLVLQKEIKRSEIDFVRKKVGMMFR